MKIDRTYVRIPCTFVLKRLDSQNIVWSNKTVEQLIKRLNIGWEYPRNPESNTPYILTTDFMLTMEQDEKRSQIARTVKTAKDLEKQAVAARVELERRYYEAEGIDWALITDKGIPKLLAVNVEWIHSAYCLEATTDMVAEDLRDVASVLNAERAEEERNGLIRWLCPEYQAPNEVKAQQQVLTGVVEPEETIIAPVEQKPFPKQPKEQLAAIRDLLRTSSGEWSIEQIAAQFKNGGRNKGAIAENLERLEWFGVLMVREEGQIKHWQFAEMQQAS